MMKSKQLLSTRCATSEMIDYMDPASEKLLYFKSIGIIQYELVFILIPLRTLTNNKSPTAVAAVGLLCGAPDRIRTCNLLIRSQLYNKNRAGNSSSRMAEYQQF